MYSTDFLKNICLVGVWLCHYSVLRASKDPNEQRNLLLRQLNVLVPSSGAKNRIKQIWGGGGQLNLRILEVSDRGPSKQ